MTADTPYWDPYDSRLTADPWPVFRRIREKAPLDWDEAKLQHTSSVRGRERLPLLVG